MAFCRRLQTTHRTRKAPASPRLSTALLLRRLRVPQHQTPVSWPNPESGEYSNCRITAPKGTSKATQPRRVSFGAMSTAPEHPLTRLPLRVTLPANTSRAPLLNASSYRSRPTSRTRKPIATKLVPGAGVPDSDPAMSGSVSRGSVVTSMSVSLMPSKRSIWPSRARRVWTTRRPMRRSLRRLRKRERPTARIR